MASLSGELLAQFLASVNVIVREEDDPLPYEIDIERDYNILIGARTHLYTTQDYLSLTRVKRYARHPGDHDVVEIVQMRNGQKWIWNGHHRIVAARLTGSPLYANVTYTKKPWR